MEAVVDSIRRIIEQHAKTTIPIVEDASIGDDTLTVRTTRKLKVGDEVIIRGMIDGKGSYEKPDGGFRIKEVIDDNHVKLSSPVSIHAWKTSENASLQKVVFGDILESVYFGDVENISHFPAITIQGISESSEAFTLGSWKDTYNVEIGIFVEDSTMEKGYRFLLRLTKLIKKALAQNIFPLIGDYDIFNITEDIVAGDRWITVEDNSVFCPGDIILIEDPYKTFETRVSGIRDDGVTVDLSHPVLINKEVGEKVFLTSDQYGGQTSIIRITRFIFESYPKNVQYGKIHKNTLLKASVIQWYGLEEVITPAGGGGHADTHIK
jgi:hypothetical protein